MVLVVVHAGAGYHSKSKEQDYSRGEIGGCMAFHPYSDHKINCAQPSGTLSEQRIAL